jgi:hypothetical protein
VAVSTTADAAKTSVPIIRNFFKAMQPVTWEQNQIVPLFSDSSSQFTEKVEAFDGQFSVGSARLTRPSEPRQLVPRDGNFAGALAGKYNGLPNRWQYHARAAIKQACKDRRMRCSKHQLGGRCRNAEEERG